MTAPPKRIIRLDSSSDELMPCLRNFQFVNRMGLVPKLGRPPLDWGAALHRGVADWYKQKARGGIVDSVGIIDQAVHWYNEKLCLKTHPRSGVNLRACLMEYFAEYADDPFTPLTLPDGESLIEKHFALPLYSNEHTDVLLVGKIDGVGLMRSYANKVVIKDLKHSSSNKPESHMTEQLTRPQFHIYAWALKELGLVDDLCPTKYLPVVVDCVYIDKKYEGCKLRRSPPTVMEDHIVEATMKRVKNNARLLAELPDDEVWDMHFGMCHKKFGKCEFFDLCQVPVASQQVAIDIMFTTRTYDPATFDD